jgi:hypothetical protein
MLLPNLPTEILLQILSHLTSHELAQLCLSNRAFSHVTFSIFSRAIRLDYAYRDDRSLLQLKAVINKIKHHFVDYLSNITIAHFSWLFSSALRHQMMKILSLLPNLKTLHLKEHFGSLRGVYLPSQNPGKINEDLYSSLLRSPFTSSIQSLKIDDSRISAHVILIIFKQEKLEHLSVEGLKCPIGTEPTFSLHSNLESLSISISANPTGRHIDLILARVPKLKKFVWKFDVSSILNLEEFRKSLDVGMISVAIKPLRCTLEELSIEVLGIEGGGNFGTGLDVEGFENLRYLKVSEEVIFVSYKEMDDRYSERALLEKKLLEKLPRALERLEGSFLIHCHIFS